MLRSFGDILETVNNCTETQPRNVQRRFTPVTSDARRESMPKNKETAAG
jgi:hypothetical protein